MRKVEKVEPFGHSEAAKNIFFRQSLIIFPVLQKLTHMWNVPIEPFLTLLTLFFVGVLQMYIFCADAFKGMAVSYTFSIVRSYTLHSENSYISRAILCQKRVPHRVVLINEEERRKMRFWEKDATLGGRRLRQKKFNFIPQIGSKTFHMYHI